MLEGALYARSSYSGYDGDVEDNNTVGSLAPGESLARRYDEAIGESDAEERGPLVRERAPKPDSDIEHRRERFVQERPQAKWARITAPQPRTAAAQHVGLALESSIKRGGTEDCHSGPPSSERGRVAYNAVGGSNHHSSTSSILVGSPASKKRPRQDATESKGWETKTLTGLPVSSPRLLKRASISVDTDSDGNAVGGSRTSSTAPPARPPKRARQSASTGSRKGCGVREEATPPRPADPTHHDKGSLTHASVIMLQLENNVLYGNYVRNQERARLRSWFDGLAQAASPDWQPKAEDQSDGA
ncbi:MAG: hypothetical protein M1813_008675 [Trichoglossum hirsutum]|nr:MAG: hypothetical protein M1813_008675 [Trichoglossum hirsutum]